MFKQWLSIDIAHTREDVYSAKAISALTQEQNLGLLIPIEINHTFFALEGLLRIHLSDFESVAQFHK